MRDMTTPALPDVASIATDPDVFEVFYREHLEAVQRYVARRVAYPHLAADLTADVFLAAVDSAASYCPDRGTPGSWLLGIARHVLATEFRRQSRDRDVLRRISGGACSTLTLLPASRSGSTQSAGPATSTTPLRPYLDATAPSWNWSPSTDFQSPKQLPSWG